MVKSILKLSLLSAVVLTLAAFSAAPSTVFAATAHQTREAQPLICAPVPAGSHKQMGPLSRM